MKFLIIAIFFIFFSSTVHSQEFLYMHREFKKAYQNKTRSFTGEPGENYWQNSLIYNMDVEVVPKTWQILGKAKISYTNKSNDSLGEIYIKLHPNHYKKGALRANEIPIENLTNGMLIEALSFNGKNITLKGSSKYTNLAPENIDTTITSNKITKTEGSSYIRLNLSNPIPPNSTTQMSLNWSTYLPSVYVNRMGAYDLESAFVGYWYPQIAVYDDIDGWDDSEYTGAQEYYTDYADYHVNIKVPEDYHISATGSLLNPEQVFNKEVQTKYVQSKKSLKVVTIIEGGKSVKKSSKKQVWKFEAKNVRDFAFGLSNNFKWISQRVQLKTKSISSNLIYDTKDEKYARRVLEVQKKSLLYLSDEFPGIPYPYDAFTTYMGVPEFDGMEFPMMANNGFSKNIKSNDYMTFHEISHTFFPHLVGVNEIKYSWMEEGWATFFTIKFIQELYKGTPEKNRQLKRTIQGYLVNAGKQWESPLIAPTNHLTIRKGHFQLSYRKPAFMLLALEDLLGENVFKKCLKEYINRWKGKHPTPYDFMFTFNNVSARNLNWFWKKWVFEYGYADLALVGFTENKLTIENVGGLPVPIKLNVVYQNGTSTIIKKTPILWRDATSTIQLEIPNINELHYIELLSDDFPDVNIKNNKINKN